MDSNKTAQIKVILNHQAETCFTLRFADDGRKLLVKIIINDVNDLTNMATTMKTTISQSFGYIINWNWKSCPKAKNNLAFKDIMLKLFGAKRFPLDEDEGLLSKLQKNISNGNSMTSIEIENMVTAAKSYADNYGTHPDFSITHTDKGRKKIHNYLKACLAKPHMTITDALLIAKQLK
jgi:hypothetical protein